MGEKTRPQEKSLPRLRFLPMLQRYAMQGVQTGGQQEVQEGSRFQRESSQAAFPCLLIGRQGPVQNETTLLLV